MVLDTLNEYICRVATSDDVAAMYDVLVPYVCYKSLGVVADGIIRKQLLDNIKLYVNKYDSVVVEKDGVVVGAYIGQGNYVVHFACNAGKLATLLLSHVVFNGMHNKYVDSYFTATPQSYIKRTKKSEDKHVRVSKDNKGVVDVRAKLLAETMFNVRKRG